MIVSETAACDAVPDGVTIDCNVAGATTIEIGSSFSASDQPLIFAMTGGVSIKNYGVFAFDVSPSSLFIVGDGVTYEGHGARFSNVFGAAIDASSQGPGVDYFTLDDEITSQDGLHAYSVEADIVVEVAGGYVDATFFGLSLQTSNPDAHIEVTIADGARVQGGLVPIQIMTDGTSKLSVAGRLEGSANPSQLGAGDSELELQPGYFIGGTVDAEGGSNTLTWGGSGAGSFDLAEIGSKYLSFQTFRKAGSSDWTLSGTTTQALGLTVESGSLWLDGSLLGSDRTTIAAHAILGGTGTAGSLDVFGTLSPGHGGGTLHAGDVVFYPGSFLEIDSDTDRLEVASIDLTEATLLVRASAGMVGTRTIIQSDAPITTTFKSIATESTSSRYTSTVVFQTNSGELDVEEEPESPPAGDGGTGDGGSSTGGGGSTGGDGSGGEVVVVVTPTGTKWAAYARTPEERGVADWLDAMGEAAPYYGQMDNMSDAEIQAFLAQLAGTELAATGETLIKSAGEIGTAALGRIQQQSSAVSPYAGPLGYASGDFDLLDGRPASLWGRLIAGTSSFGSTSTGSVALIGGADLQFSGDSTLGVLLGVGSSATSAGATRTSATSLSAGIYGSQGFGDTALRFVASGAVNLVESKRRVTGPGVDDTYTALHPAFGVHLLGEVGHSFHLGLVTAELYADLSYSGVASPAYSETGGPAPLSVGSSWADAAETALGARVSQSFAFGTVLADFGGSAAWIHRFGGASKATHSIAGGAPFEVAAQAATTDALRVTLDARLDLDGSSGLDVAYMAQLQADGTAQSISFKYARKL